MVAKGAWLNRPTIYREARQTNEHDVRVAAIKALEAAICQTCSDFYVECYASKIVHIVKEQK